MSLFCLDHTQKTADSTLTPLIIFHGMFGSGDNWLSIAKEIGCYRSVWTIDLPGHGKSYNPEFPENELGIFNYGIVADGIKLSLREIAETIKASKFILCGHSMGGKAAMAVALKFPHMIQGILVIDSAPLDYRGRGYNSQVLKMIQEIDTNIFQSRIAANSALSAYIPDPIVRGFLLKSLQSNGNGGLRWRFNASAILNEGLDIADWPFTEGSFLGAALFLKGELSNYIDENSIYEIRKFFPNAIIESIPNANHWIHIDNKTSFMMHVSNFLSKIDGVGEK